MPPSNVLPFHGNEKTMNLNSMILTNIQASPYFKVQLYELKTYHQVIDEIYTRVNHLEPWEKGSRKTAGQTGMCGGVRGVGAGGIVSSSFCLLYKLFTLKLTRKQLIGLCTHTDSPYIRGIGLMYARFTFPPGDLWDWFSMYLDDEEEVDVKAGGGHVMTIGEVANHFLTKLEWYSTLFPRIPVPIQKQIEQHLLARKAARISAGLAANSDRAGAAAQEDRSRTGRQEEHIPTYERRSSPPMYGRRSPVYGRYDGEQCVTSPDAERERRPPAERRRSRSADRRDRPDVDRHRSSQPDADRHRSSHGRRSAERDRDKYPRPSSDRHRSSRDRRSRSRERRRDDRHSRSDRERTHHRSHRSRSREHGHSHSRSRHSSPSRKEHRERPRASKEPERSSPAKDSKCSRSPKDNDPFEQDLQKELERVRSSKSAETENGV